VGSFLFIILSFVLPYFLLARWKRLSAEEALVASFGASSLLFGATAFITHVAGLNQEAAHWVVLVALTLLAAPGLRHGFGRLKRAVSFPLWGFFSALLLLIMTLQAAFPVYIGGFWYFDWWQHYDLSRMYMDKVPHDYLWLGIYNFASRTPLMNLNAAFFLSILGDNYSTFQIVASILNSTFLLPAYLLCRRMSGKRTAAMVTALLFLSPSIVHNTWYPWPKLFAAYFVLLAAYFYLKHRRGGYIPDNTACVLVFALVWAGFLAHQSSLFSSIVILLDMFLRALRREPRRFLLLGLACVLCFVVINGGWFAWATSLFGMKRSFLSYYQRPATVGGLSGYLILFSYHSLATVCSPLFVYDLAGKQFDILNFFEHLQVLYYNSFVGFGTVTVFIAALAVLAKGVTAKENRPAYARYALGIQVRGLLLPVGVSCFAIAAMIFLAPAFGDALFSHSFNHPQFARKMFGALFLGGAFVASAAAAFLWLFARRSPEAQLGSARDFDGWLLFWMAVAGYAGGIATHHELYIHGMVSAGCATSVLLTALLLARVCSDVSRFKRLFLAVPLFCESFLITWLPLLIIRYDWGWAGEKNWQLKEQNSLVLMADLFPDAWWALAAVGLTVQAAMLIFWVTASREERHERGC
jgi:hypothetical protein